MAVSNMNKNVNNHNPPVNLVTVWVNWLKLARLKALKNPRLCSMACNTIRIKNKYFIELFDKSYIKFDNNVSAGLQ